jgi:hypothetical protein
MEGVDLDRTWDLLRSAITRYIKYRDCRVMNTRAETETFRFVFLTYSRVTRCAIKWWHDSLGATRVTG